NVELMGAVLLPAAHCPAPTDDTIRLNDKLAAIETSVVGPNQVVCDVFVFVNINLMPLRSGDGCRTHLTKKDAIAQPLRREALFIGLDQLQSKSTHNKV
ncbi:MAG: hypothetical protein VX930_04255, partial [Pseudomonadota bacterium]|nr:hypothetical protein [Pseudomonadota bacterium]